MKVVVFGASGKVGRQVVQGLLDEGNHVTAFVHSSSPFAANAQLSIAKGDIYDDADVAQAVRGADVVVSALGSWGTKRKDVVSSGMRAIVAAMHAAGVKRVVSLTGSDALAAGDSKTLLSRASHRLITLSPARRILRDGEEHIRLLEQSGLDWTVVRSPVMNERGNPERFILGRRRPKPWATVNRRSVALAMVRLVSEPGYARQAPFITRGA
jgi:putative NADH-flavin reductase